MNQSNWLLLKSPVTCKTSGLTSNTSWMIFQTSHRGWMWSTVIPLTTRQLLQI